jgi:hypothetical protein
VALLALVKHYWLAQVWDPRISDVSAIVRVANVTISPHFGTVFSEICLALSRLASAQLLVIPKLVSLAYVVSAAETEAVRRHINLQTFLDTPLLEYISQLR